MSTQHTADLPPLPDLPEPDHRVMSHARRDEFYEGYEAETVKDYARTYARAALATQAAQPEQPLGYMNAGQVHEMAQGRIDYGYVYPKANQPGATVAIYATQPVACNAGELCLDCSPRNDDSKCPDALAGEASDAVNETNAVLASHYIALTCGNTVKPVQAQGVPAQYFSFDDDNGFKLHSTAREAKSAAQAAIDAYRKDATEEWPGEVESVCWGAVRESSTQADKTPNGWVFAPCVDFALTAPKHAQGVPSDRQRLDDYATEINRLRNVVQAACSGGLDHMIERWKQLFPDAPIPTVRAPQQAKPLSDAHVELVASWLEKQRISIPATGAEMAAGLRYAGARGIKGAK